jgi:hypothetical protein
LGGGDQGLDWWSGNEPNEGVAAFEDTRAEACDGWSSWIHTTWWIGDDRGGEVKICDRELERDLELSGEETEEPKDKETEAKMSHEEEETTVEGDVESVYKGKVSKTDDKVSDAKETEGDEPKEGETKEGGTNGDQSEEDKSKGRNNDEIWAEGNKSAKSGTEGGELDKGKSKRSGIDKDETEANGSEGTEFNEGEAEVNKLGPLGLEGKEVSTTEPKQVPEDLVEKRERCSHPSAQTKSLVGGGSRSQPPTRLFWNWTVWPVGVENRQSGERNRAGELRYPSKGGMRAATAGNRPCSQGWWAATVIAPD